MQKKYILILILLLIGIGAVTWYSLSTDSTSEDPTVEQIKTDPLDTATAMYAPWLSALQATTTTEYGELLAAAPVSEELRSALQLQIDQPVSEVDPVICQPDVPKRLGAKIVYQEGAGAQVMVVARGDVVPERAIYTLEWRDTDWVITDITCTKGEVAPDLEYTFDITGALLKDSLQPPLDSSLWHLIYERDGVAGYAIPLEFTATSMCIGDSEVVCDTTTLSEATTVKIQGQMQESGVLVERLEFQ